MKKIFDTLEVLHIGHTYTLDVGFYISQVGGDVQDLSVNHFCNL